MAEARDRLTLQSVDGAEAKLSGSLHNVLTRKGMRSAVAIDRRTWEDLGRPVDLAPILHTDPATDPPNPVGDVLHEIGMERADQMASGYTTQHDDEHGLEHIVDQARGRILPQQLRTRDDLVEAAACLVAAIEWMDRQASPYPDGMTA